MASVAAEQTAEVRANYIGVHELTLDDKRRVALFRCFNIQVGEQFALIALPRAKCIRVQPLAGLDLSENPSLASSLTQVKTDRERRALVPGGLARWFNLKAKEQVEIVGCGLYFEIWNKGDWENEKPKRLEQASKDLARIDAANPT